MPLSGALVIPWFLCSSHVADAAALKRSQKKSFLHTSTWGAKLEESGSTGFGFEVTRRGSLPVESSGRFSDRELSGGLSVV
eukprot:CAMPEP_0177670422 /NCGR_PEP_ID=MMETSP0447-20121125/24076_1 /TAXON_ID=0 /ORGANISM="Stygamoeba regulata, Strain BSH-02190019" /LENGTH=80 /DNA_ID=CAMNT_0019177575 /DNA_START=20 /DNA_END=262 /DNA_ORIENTATION=+